ncbi:uncharacterized protein LOC116247058 [Nymphaea colorata]|nr:uncharacterized protein LOC116247058 [Nymphaea colorata]
MADADTKPKQAKIVKKEKVEVQEKKVVANGGKKEAFSKTVKVKKEERTTSGTLNDGKVKKKSTTVATKKKKEVARQKVSENGKDRQKAKKVYDLPGQKHDPPEERDPLRIFYETLHEQVPTSDMAAVWLMERGLLPEDVAKMVYEKKLKKNMQQKVGTPVKTATMKKSVKSAVKKSPASNPSKASKTAPKSSKRQKPDTSDSDDDFIVSRVVKKARAC